MNFQLANPRHNQLGRGYCKVFPAAGRQTIARIRSVPRRTRNFNPRWGDAHLVYFVHIVHRVLIVRDSTSPRGGSRVAPMDFMDEMDFMDRMDNAHSQEGGLSPRGTAIPQRLYPCGQTTPAHGLSAKTR